MEGNLNAQIRFGDGSWNKVRARHMRANLYMVIVSMGMGVALPPELYQNPPRIDILIEGQPATYVHSNTMRVTKEGEIVFLAVTEPGSVWNG